MYLNFVVFRLPVADGKHCNDTFVTRARQGARLRPSLILCYANAPVGHFKYYTQVVVVSRMTSAGDVSNNSTLTP